MNKLLIALLLLILPVISPAATVTLGETRNVYLAGPARQHEVGLAEFGAGVYVQIIPVNVLWPAASTAVVPFTGDRTVTVQASLNGYVVGSAVSASKVHMYIYRDDVFPLAHTLTKCIAPATEKCVLNLNLVVQDIPPQGTHYYSIQVLPENSAPFYNSAYITADEFF